MPTNYQFWLNNKIKNQKNKVLPQFSKKLIWKKANGNQLEICFKDSLPKILSILIRIIFLKTKIK